MLLENQENTNWLPSSWLGVIMLMGYNLIIYFSIAKIIAYGRSSIKSISWLLTIAIDGCPLGDGGLYRSWDKSEWDVGSLIKRTVPGRADRIKCKRCHLNER